MQLNLTKTDSKRIKDNFGGFLDLLGTATNRGTHYNTKEEVRAATLDSHQKIFNSSRDIYSLSLLVPGITDYSKQVGLVNLLKNSIRSDNCVLTETQEKQIIHILSNNLEPARMLKVFKTLKVLKINNSRTRKLILYSILNAKNLELWSVKYKKLARLALKHAWGEKVSNNLVYFLTKETKTEKELNQIKKYIDKYIIYKSQKDEIYQCIRFIFGQTNNVSLPLLVQYQKSKQNISEGLDLPLTTLTGIKNFYHPNIDQKSLIKNKVKKSPSTMTDREKVSLQKKVKEVNETLDFDPTKLDLIKLYIHCYQTNEMNQNILDAIEQKSLEASKTINMKFNTIGIIVDTSYSMIGNETQQYRPISSALATAKMLNHIADEKYVIYTNHDEKTELPIPMGETELATSVIQLLKEKVDAIFIISDGYENSIAGRTGEVINITRKMGNHTPIYHFSSVTASESKSVKTLSDDIYTLPINDPNAIGITILKSLFENDISTGLQALFNIVKPVLENCNKIKYLQEGN